MKCCPLCGQPADLKGKRFSRAERNADILARYQADEPIKTIAYFYGITESAVVDIALRAGAKRRNAATWRSHIAEIVADYTAGIRCADIESKYKIPNGSISRIIKDHGGNRPLPRIQQRIYDFVAAHPAGSRTVEIAQHVYAWDEGGGPNTLNVINAHIHFLNKKLSKCNEKIVASGGPGSRYRLVSLKGGR